MPTIVIGDIGGSHISFVTGARERDAHHGVDYLRAAGSFRVSGLQGEFATKIYVPVGQMFAREVAQMTETLAGELKFRTGEEHLGDIELSMKMKKLGQVSVDVEVNHQPTMMNPTYHAEFGFDVDQSYLPKLLSALKSTFPVQQ